MFCLKQSQIIKLEFIKINIELKYSLKCFLQAYSYLILEIYERAFQNKREMTCAKLGISTVILIINMAR